MFGMEIEAEKCYNIRRFEAIARLGNGKVSSLKKTGELDIRGTVVRVVKIDGEGCMRSVVQSWRIRHNWLKNEVVA